MAQDNKVPPFGRTARDGNDGVESAQSISVKYDLILFNADGGEHKYLCRILPSNDAPPLFEVTGDAKFADEGELRQRLTGILLSSEIENAVGILHSHHLREVRFRNVEIANHRIQLLGWKMRTRM